jgi:hypothetical protein
MLTDLLRYLSVNKMIFYILVSYPALVVSTDEKRSLLVTLRDLNIYSDYKSPKSTTPYIKELVPLNDTIAVLVNL